MQTSPRRPGLALVVALGTVSALGLTACAGGGFEPPATTSTASAPASSPGPVTVQMLIGASTPTELAAVRTATDAWAAQTGNTVRVTTSANLPVDIEKGFAGGAPADLFYVDPAHLGAYAEAGNLYPYGDKIRGVTYIDSLKSTFTYDNKFYCAPKDFSTLALVINEGLWTKAGLTDADVPEDWADLETVAAKLTTGGVTGLVINPDNDRVGVFLRQAGGWWVDDQGAAMTAASPENVAGLTEVKKLLTNGSMKFASDLGLGWGGEALIKGKAAMTIEGNWIRGALKDAPTMRVKVVELPAGPAGKGTLSFMNCWGIGAKSPNQAAAMDLVTFLGSDEQQLAAAKAFGVMPATQSAMDAYTSGGTEQDAAFASSARFARGPINQSALTPVLADFSSRLAKLASSDPTAMLDQVQKDGTAALTG